MKKILAKVLFALVITFGEEKGAEIFEQLIDFIK